MFKKLTVSSFANAIPSHLPFICQYPANLRANPYRSVAAAHSQAAPGDFRLLTFPINLSHMLYGLANRITQTFPFASSDGHCPNIAPGFPESAGSGASYLAIHRGTYAHILKCKAADRAFQSHSWRSSQICSLLSLGPFVFLSFCRLRLFIKSLSFCIVHFLSR